MANLATRRLRLKSDYEEMKKIQNQSYVSWVVSKGVAPYVEEYLLTIKVRTYYAPGKTMNTCKVQITLPTDYPYSAPSAKMISEPLVYHPHWFLSGSYCPGSWGVSESLLRFTEKMIETLQNNPDRINPSSPANKEAMAWYLKNKNNKSLFPSDTTKLTEKRGFKTTKKNF